MKHPKHIGRIYSFETAHCQIISFTATDKSDKAYGAFAFFNMIIYFVWAIILHVHRESVISAGCVIYIFKYMRCIHCPSFLRSSISKATGGYVDHYEETSNPMNRSAKMDVGINGAGDDYDDDVYANEDPQAL